MLQADRDSRLRFAVVTAVARGCVPATGYLVGPEPVAAAVRKTMQPFTVNSIAQAAAVASLAAESELLERVELVVKGRPDGIAGSWRSTCA